MTSQEIEDEVKKLDAQSKALRKEVYQLAWYMRGSLSVEQAFSMDVLDREIINDIVKDNLEITKESKLPFF